VREDPLRHHLVGDPQKHLPAEGHLKHLLAATHPKDLIYPQLLSYPLREEAHLKHLVDPRVPHPLVEDLQKHLRSPKDQLPHPHQVDLLEQQHQDLQLPLDPLEQRLKLVEG
jgi:hypothetical protein